MESSSDDIQIEDLLRAEELLLPLSELLQLVPEQYHNTIKRYKCTQFNSSELRYKGISIVRCIHTVNTTKCPIQKSKMFYTVESRFKEVLNSEGFTFNRLQCDIFNSVYYTKDNLLLSAPTGSGKSLIPLMVHFKLFKNKRYKVLCIFPLRALVAQNLKYFKSLSIKVGDLKDGCSISFAHYDIIVCTPEKALQFLLRKKVKFDTLVFDEIHLIDDCERGYTVELILSILKMSYSKVRLIAQSATVPQPESISKYIGGSLLNYTDEYRPYPLIVDYIKEYSDSKLLRLISSDSRNTLIFVEKIKETRRLYEILSQYFTGKDIYIHHSLISEEERTFIETLPSYFIIISTPTLAWGINITIDTLIIRDRFSILNTVQMVGRTGRLNSGRAIVFSRFKEEMKILTSKMEGHFTEVLLVFLDRISSKKTPISRESINKWYESTYSFMCGDELMSRLFNREVERLKRYKFIEVIGGQIYITPLVRITVSSGICFDIMCKMINLLNIDTFCEMKTLLLSLPIFYKERESPRNILRVFKAVGKLCVYKKKAFLLNEVYGFISNTLGSKAVEISIVLKGNILHIEYYRGKIFILISGMDDTITFHKELIVSNKMKKFNIDLPYMVNAVKVYDLNYTIVFNEQVLNFNQPNK